MNKHQIEISIDIWDDDEEYPYFLNIKTNGDLSELPDESYATREDAVEEAEFIIDRYIKDLGRRNLKIIRNY